jgi:hypothetical protein
VNAPGGARRPWFESRIAPANENGASAGAIRSKFDLRADSRGRCVHTILALVFARDEVAKFAETFIDIRLSYGHSLPRATRLGITDTQAHAGHTDPTPDEAVSGRALV